MKLLSISVAAVIFCLFVIAACQKQNLGDDKQTPSGPVCAYNTPANRATLGKKWSNTFIRTDTYNADGKTISSTKYIYPIGFFQLNTDSTYNVFSNNVPLKGKWTINKNCQLVLDSGNVTLQRDFDILAVSSDSLTIRRKQGNIVYTQHYRLFNCTDESSLDFTWNNTYITTDYLANASGNTVLSRSIVYPVGYFKLNADATYNVVSNGVPLNGTWLLNGNNCRLVLDPTTPIERSFDIVQVSKDSLTISRKDTSSYSPVIYTQHYKKN